MSPPSIMFASQIEYILNVRYFDTIWQNSFYWLSNLMHGDL
jgi:hypothetical protein